MPTSAATREVMFGRSGGWSSHIFAGHFFHASRTGLYTRWALYRPPGALGNILLPLWLVMRFSSRARRRRFRCARIARASPTSRNGRWHTYTTARHRGSSRTCGRALWMVVENHTIMEPLGATMGICHCPPWRATTSAATAMSSCDLMRNHLAPVLCVGALEAAEPASAVRMASYSWWLLGEHTKLAEVSRRTSWACRNWSTGPSTWSVWGQSCSGSTA